MKITQVYFLIVLFSIVIISESIRCRRQCLFIDFPLNQSLPVNACDPTTQNNSQCSVYIEIHRHKLTVRSRLGIQSCETPIENRVETVVKLNSTLITIIRYACRFDDCDSEFLTDLLSNITGIPDVNQQDIKQNIADEIYTANLGQDFNCTDSQICSASNLCQGRFQVNGLPGNTSFDFIEDATCINPLQDDYLLNIIESRGLNDTKTTRINFRCNHESCLNDNSLAERIYNAALPYNISITFPSPANGTNESCSTNPSTGTSNFVVPYGLINVFVIFTFFNVIYLPIL